MCCAGALRREEPHADARDADRVAHGRGDAVRPVACDVGNERPVVVGEGRCAHAPRCRCSARARQRACARPGCPPSPSGRVRRRRSRRCTREPSHVRGSAVMTPSTSVKITTSSALSATPSAQAGRVASAAAERGDPCRPPTSPGTRRRPGCDPRRSRRAGRLGTPRATDEFAGTPSVTIPASAPGERGRVESGRAQLVRDHDRRDDLADTREQVASRARRQAASVDESQQRVGRVGRAVPAHRRDDDDRCTPALDHLADARSERGSAGRVGHRRAAELHDDYRLACRDDRDRLRSATTALLPHQLLEPDDEPARCEPTSRTASTTPGMKLLRSMVSWRIESVCP